MQPMNPAFKAFINQPASKLQELANAKNRFSAAAAGQVLHALNAKALGDKENVARHLRRAETYWLQSQETANDQLRRAMDKIEALRDE